MAIKGYSLPHWTFDADEVSSGVYLAIGTDESGRRIEKKGTDPDALLTECRQAAAAMDADAAFRVDGLFEDFCAALRRLEVGSNAGSVREVAELVSKAVADPGISSRTELDQIFRQARIQIDRSSIPASEAMLEAFFSLERALRRRTARRGTPPEVPPP